VVSETSKSIKCGIRSSANCSYLCFCNIEFGCWGSLLQFPTISDINSFSQHFSPYDKGLIAILFLQIFSGNNMKIFKIFSLETSGYFNQERHPFGILFINFNNSVIFFLAKKIVLKYAFILFESACFLLSVLSTFNHVKDCVLIPQSNLVFGRLPLQEIFLCKA